MRFLCIFMYLHSERVKMINDCRKVPTESTKRVSTRAVSEWEERVLLQECVCVHAYLCGYGRVFIYGHL